MNLRIKIGAILIAILIILSFFYLKKFQNISITTLNLYDRGFKITDFKLEVNDCNLLFSRPPLNIFNLSKTYFDKLEEFEGEAKKYMPNGKYVDGYTTLSKDKLFALHYVAQAPFVKTICETGFNYGHSSYNYLTAKSDTIVYSFDIGYHSYIRKMHKKLETMFPNRSYLVLGDSTKTIPKYIEENKNFQCDMILVDGAHSYKEGLADLTNFIKVINKKNNVIFFDDYPSPGSAAYGKAWEEMLKNGVINEIFRCHNFKNKKYAFSAGFAK